MIGALFRRLFESRVESKVMDEAGTEHVTVSCKAVFTNSSLSVSLPRDQFTQNVVNFTKGQTEG